MIRVYTTFMIVLAVALSGCLERKLQIKSEPAGALVYLADQEIGRTPVTVDFSWYGDYEVTLRHDGYQSLQTHKRIFAPFWEYPPVDLLCEIMPWTISNQVEWDFELQPATLPSDQQLIENARAMAK